MEEAHLTIVLEDKETDIECLDRLLRKHPWLTMLLIISLASNLIEQFTKLWTFIDALR